MTKPKSGSRGSAGGGDRSLPLTYARYLKLDTLLSLQVPASDPPEHDETLFIVIHQVYELWFRLLLHEFEKIRRDFTQGELFEAIATWKRVRMVLKTLVAQIDVLETMTPMSFLTFRDRLEAASGFQSTQFREMEFLLGHKRPEMLERFPAGDPARAPLERRLNERSLVDHFYDFLAGLGVAIPDALRKRDVRTSNEPNADIQEALLKLYHGRPDVAILLELMTDFDEGLQEWRYRHVMMVQRTIGNKMGTGGSLGVEYLKASLFKPIFPDLWLIRNRL
ncbi:MAG TPA: tryptophan 2,3-dioxygenase family protein [Candidatus Polarisedimenticolia bacterium]|nr:tryptophan 2,3-dioxygenase family protein [Candidatus Polarisedimenticolia bacterium]